MLGILFSGGKDSVFTAYYYLEQGWDVKCLISLRSKNPDSWMFHTPAIEMTQLQSEALGIPIVSVETGGEKEEELRDLEEALKIAKEKHGIRAVAVGALLSDYQHERVNRVCHSLGLKCFAPLWHKDQGRLLREIISLGFDVRLVGIAAHGLDESFLGARIDRGVLARFMELHGKYGFHVGGEGGEYESLVADCPVFRKRIELLETEKLMGGDDAGRLEIRVARLAPK